jgi:hypothetical protein
MVMAALLLRTTAAQQIPIAVGNIGRAANVRVDAGESRIAVEVIALA